MSTMTVVTTEAQKGFYPTPPALAKKLVEGLNFSEIHDILEPSAGTGNLIYALAPSFRAHYYRYHYDVRKMNIDCCEIDPAIRGILKENFSETALDACKNSQKEILDAEHCDKYSSCQNMSEAAKKVYEPLRDMEVLFEHSNIRIVHDDFLTFHPEKHYDAILMNPPFADGDKHLLKAIQIQKRSGGIIRCILNAETIRNPYTKTRLMLAQWLQELDADIEFLENAFVDAERATDVEVAVIKIDIPEPTLDSEFWKHCEKAQREAEPEMEAPTDLVLPDIIKGFVARYNVEVEAGRKLIREYMALKPYIMRTIPESEDTAKYDKPILMLGIGSHADEHPSVNKYVEAVRYKYWSLLFKRQEFVGQLTQNLCDMLNRKVDEMANYEFSEFNIRQILLEMTCRMQEGVVETILDLFEKLTVKHSYSEEFGNNIHYFTGWKTNKAWKIGKKVIIPGYVYPSDSWSKDTFETYRAYKLLCDIEKALNYLDGNMTPEVNLQTTLSWANQDRRTRNIKCKYFDATFYKKGTVHLTFTCPELIDRFNIFCARQRGWLPPTYGRTAYANMNTEEKEVVDSFHGDGTEGSGEKGYKTVMDRAGYFLAPPNNQILSLGAGMEGNV